ncbi:OmpA family protein [Qipengyuania nanhaisediminis]|uniref:OmpA family protein n=1 Tax=Qipengyuania nanhaisediminis TaxID=604088 RepID=UPI0038B2D262
MNTARITLSLALIAALAACKAERSGDDGDPVGSGDPVIVEGGEATPGTGERTSILRPDVEAEQPLPSDPLDPLEVTIGFLEGGAALDTAARTALKRVLESGQLAEGGAITLRGHSDTGGSDAANMRVSQRRAEAVRDWLTERGVEADRFTIIAFGEQNPVEPNAHRDGTPNEDGRAANRRVELTIAVEPGAADAPATASTESGD